MEIKKLTATDAETKSADMVAENITKLKALFPEIITEGPKGAVVNMDVLKALVGDGTVTDAEEKYGLNWHGKRRARQLALTPSTGTLRPCPEDSVDWNTTQNLMIEGDNLEVLKLLQKSYAGKVKLIYIDPPYNTGQDFVYPDNFHDNIRNYLELTGQVEGGQKISSNAEASGRFHTDWLNMIYPRLKLARNLLREDGVFFVSIDDTEGANLRKLCDDVFGEENLVGTLIMQTATDNNPTQINTEHEYMLVYGRNTDSLPDWGRKSEKAELIQQQYLELKARHRSNTQAIQDALRKWIRANADKLEGVAHYDNVDERGVFHDGDIQNTKFGGYRYEVIHPQTKRPCKVPEKGFRFPKETLHRMIAEGNVMFGPDETTLIKPKKRLENAKELMRSVIYEDGRAATKRLESLLDRGVFNNPKSETTLAAIIDFVTDSDSLVVDYFAGSGATAHAVWLQNMRDSGTRRFVLVQLPEPLDPENKDQKTAADYCDKLKKPRNIAELTKERLRRAAKKIKEENPKFAGDLGFRVFKLDSTNIQEWEPKRENLEASLLTAVEHLKTGRTEADIVYELLLKLGLDLCVPIEKRTIAGKDVHAIGGGVLVACLAEKITAAEVEKLGQGVVEWHKALAPAGDTTCFFRDSAFADDVAKTNLAAILNQNGIANVKSL